MTFVFSNCRRILSVLLGLILLSGVPTSCQKGPVNVAYWLGMTLEAIELAKAKCMKAIRLDALATNTPAHKLYESQGFEYRGKQNLYAENTGWTDFFFFEYK